MTSAPERSGIDIATELLRELLVIDDQNQIELGKAEQNARGAGVRHFRD